MKKYLLILLLAIFIIPSIAFASWWNPLSWSIWNIFRPTPHAQVQIATTITPTTVATTTEKADTKVVSTKKPVVDSTQKVSQPNIKQPSVAVSSQPIPTPAPSCTQDTWSCSDWLTCSSSGSQTRSCSKIFDCPSVVTQSPAISQGCTPPAPIQQNPESSDLINYQLNENQIQYIITPLSFSEDSNAPINARIKILTSDFDYTKIKSIYYNFHNYKTDGDFSLSKGIFDGDWDTANREFAFSMTLDWSLLRNSKLISIDYTIKDQNILYSIPITNGAQLTITP